MADFPYIGTPITGPAGGTNVFEEKANKGAPSGYAPLDANSKIPTANLPDQADITAHNSATTSVHGIANTANLVLTSDLGEVLGQQIDTLYATGPESRENRFTASRNKRWTVEFGASTGIVNIYFPSSGVRAGDRLRFAFTTPAGLTARINLTPAGSLDIPPLTAYHWSGYSRAISSGMIWVSDHEWTATPTSGGPMSSSDKAKLNGIASGAEVNVNADWNASSGDAQILNKPNSFTPTAHTHAISDVTNLQSKLNTKREFYYSEVFYTANADNSYSMPPNSVISDSTGPIERRILFTLSGVHTSTPYFSFPATGNAGDMVTVTNSLYRADLSSNTMRLVVREVNGTQTNTFDDILAGQTRSFIRKTSETGTGNWISVPTTAHSHGNISITGAIGSTANLPLITTTSGVVTTGTFGTTANSFCQGNDSRISGIGAGSIITSNANQINLGVYGGSITSDGYGGNINTGGYGGSISTNSYGGNLDLSDHGGSITTGPYGGAINTTGQGSIELGSVTQGNPPGTAYGRTILKGSVTGNSPQTITLPNATGTIALTNHTHAISDVTNLQSKLDTKQEYYYTPVTYSSDYTIPSTLSDTGSIERHFHFTVSGTPTYSSTTDSGIYINFPTTGKLGDIITITNSRLKINGSLNNVALLLREKEGADSSNFGSLEVGTTQSYVRESSQSGLGNWTYLPPASHAHGNITNAGAVGTTANLPLITTTSGAVTTGTFGTTTNSFCQGNDTRLDRSTFIATWGAFVTPGYRNMADNTLELINFNIPSFNTDANNYSLELGNNNNAIDGKIRIGKTGTYLVNLIYNTYDISPGSYYSFYIFTNGTSKSTASSHLVTLFDQAPAGGSVATGARYLFGGMTGIVNVNVAPLWVSLVFRPTAGNPYPTDGTSGTIIQPPRVEIIKVA